MEISHQRTECSIHFAGLHRDRLRRAVGHRQSRRRQRLRVQIAQRQQR